MNVAPSVLRLRRWRAYLDLGRVSNLPTIWTNCLAGAALAHTRFGVLPLSVLVAAFSCFYIGGMFLNDAFDHRFDAKFRLERPIPAGLVSQRQVYIMGFAFLFLGEVLLIGAAASRPGSWPLLIGGGFFLGGLIVYYNAWHKTNPLSPLVMALCRGLIYFISASLPTGVFTAQASIGTLLLVTYVAATTSLARQENLNQVKNLWPTLLFLLPLMFGSWNMVSAEVPRTAQLLSILLFLVWMLRVGSFLFFGNRNVPRAVGSLIAGISLVDAIVIASVSVGFVGPVCAVVGFLLTLTLQRSIPGT